MFRLCVCYSPDSILTNIPRENRFFPNASPCGFVRGKKRFFFPLTKPQGETLGKNDFQWQKTKLYWNIPRESSEVHAVLQLHRCSPFYTCSLWKGKKVTKVERKINKIRCRKHSFFVGTKNCGMLIDLSHLPVFVGTKNCGMLIDLSHLPVIDRTTESRRGFEAMLSGVDAHALSWTFFSASSCICFTSWFTTMSNSTSLSLP